MPFRSRSLGLPGVVGPTLTAESAAVIVVPPVLIDLMVLLGSDVGGAFCEQDVVPHNNKPKTLAVASWCTYG